MLNNQKPTRIFSVSVFSACLDNWGLYDMLLWRQKEAIAMTELSREIFNRFQVRKTKKQKLAFIALLQKHIPSLQVQEAGLAKSRNLIVGDPQTAKVILGAHYDTCARLPFPNFITP